VVEITPYGEMNSTDSSGRSGGGVTLGLPCFRLDGGRNSADEERQQRRPQEN
jgi:hypothetical protein